MVIEDVLLQQIRYFLAVTALPAILKRRKERHPTLEVRGRSAGTMWGFSE